MASFEAAVSASYFHDRSPLEAAAALTQMGVRKLEFSGLSVTALSQGDLRELKNLMDSEGASCVSLNAVGDLMPVSLGNLISPQRRERDAALAHVKGLIENATRLESKAVICDTGTTTEDIVRGDEAIRGEENALVDSCLALLEVAEPAGVSIVLQHVPGRRWIPWDGYPPDTFPVVERHVWPWRRWLEGAEIVGKIEKDVGKGRVGWAFDIANAVVAAGASPLNLAGRMSAYPARGLERVYVANHPGPYNKVWHRLLRHQALHEGVFTPADFRAVLRQLDQSEYDGEIVVLISEKDPSKEKLQRSLSMLTAGRD